MLRCTLAQKALVPILAFAGLTGLAFSATAADAPPAIGIEVDATDLAHKIFRVRETLPVRPGPLTLVQPKWLPGTHGPYGDPSAIAGLQVRAGERRIAWQRDTADAHTFHLQVPAGVDTLTVELQYLSPTTKDAGRVVMTPQMLEVQWDAMLLYPAGGQASGIRIAPQLKLPAGWQQASALRGHPRDGQWQFEPVSLETLIDSPVYAGRYMKQLPLDGADTPRPVVLNLMADAPEQLEASEQQIAAHRALVRQADELFGSRHFRHYDFLLALSDSFGGIGLEHHESSENGVKPNYFKDWDKAVLERELLPHEYVHSWNGKFRRPADLWTPDYNREPMRDSLLWMYEGQTQYWGRVLAARSGLATPEQAREGLAYAAAWAEHQAGRRWRNLQDTTNQAHMEARGGRPEWRDWQRGWDYYDESALMWLDADTLIREQSRGKRSLDDFARAFFGVHDGRIQPLTYTFDDVVKALNAVWPHDWARFLRERLDNHEHAPLDGLARAGWKLVYTEQQSEAAKAHDEDEKTTDFAYSIGLRIATEDDGTLKSVAWDSPAYRAGLAPGVKLLAVNGTAYKPERLAAAITAAKDGQHPIELLVRDGDAFRTVQIDYRGGLRYPKLERVSGTPDLLERILARK